MCRGVLLKSRASPAPRSSFRFSANNNYLKESYLLLLLSLIHAEIRKTLFNGVGQVQRRNFGSTHKPVFPIDFCIHNAAILAGSFNEVIRFGFLPPAGFNDVGHFEGSQICSIAKKLL